MARVRSKKKVARWNPTPTRAIYGNVHAVLPRHEWLCGGEGLSLGGGGFQRIIHLLIKVARALPTVYIEKETNYETQAARANVSSRSAAASTLTCLRRHS